MRKNLFCIIAITCISFSNYLNAQAPDWAWAKSAGSASNDQSTSVATDANGNVFITGYFTGASITFGATTLTSAADGGVFIVKYDTNGNVIWAKGAGSNSLGYGTGVAIDASGNAIISGSFTSASITFGATTLTNSFAGRSDVFFTKYDTNGNVLWAKGAGGTGEDNSNGIAVDANGNVVITGRFQSPAIMFGTTTLTNTGIYDVFITKYDANGNVLWAKSAVGANDEGIGRPAIDANGNVFITGFFKSLIITFGTTTLTNSYEPPYADIFIFKLDAGGNVVWAKREGNLVDNMGYDVASDTSGNVIVSGYFIGPIITFGAITLTNTNPALVQGTPDVFIVKYDAAGNVLWAKSAGGAFGDYSYKVATDGNGNVFMTGVFDSSITFGTTTLNSSGVYDIFFTKFDSNGNVLWAKGAGGGGYDYGTGIAVDAIGNIFMTGLFGSSNITFGTTTLTNAGTYDVFIAKIGATLSVEEQSDNTGMVIAPNPFTSETTISFKEEQVNTTIKIIDILGKEIQSIQFNGMQFILEKGKMQPGIYFVQALDANNTESTKKIAIK